MKVKINQSTGFSLLSTLSSRNARSGFPYFNMECFLRASRIKAADQYGAHAQPYLSYSYEAVNMDLKVLHKQQGEGPS